MRWRDLFRLMMRVAMGFAGGIIGVRVLVLLCATLIGLLLLLGVKDYPILAIDEGLYSLQAKDLTLFGEPGMNGLPHRYLSPLSLGLQCVWYQMFPANVWSARWLSVVWGCVCLLVAGVWLGRRVSVVKTIAGVLFIGSLFTFVTISRRAYLESGVMSLSSLGFLAASGSRPRHWFWLAPLTCAILLYKANAVYMLPCFLLPQRAKDWRRECLWRAGFVAAGFVAAGVVFLRMYNSAPEFALSVYQFELHKEAGERSLIGVGRFGVYPSALAAALQRLGAGYTDLCLVTVLGVCAVAVARLWDKPDVQRLVCWLVGGYAFLLLQRFQHVQYFAPLVVPAGLLFVYAVAQWGERGEHEEVAARSRLFRVRRVLLVAGLCITTMSLARVLWGWSHARHHNPPQALAAWLDRNAGDSAVLCTAEVAAAVHGRAYAFQRLLNPYPPAVAPSLDGLLRSQNVRHFAYDTWEAPSFMKACDMSNVVARGVVRARGEGWIVYERPDGGAW